MKPLIGLISKEGVATFLAQPRHFCLLNLIGYYFYPHKFCHFRVRQRLNRWVRFCTIQSLSVFAKNTVCCQDNNAGWTVQNTNITVNWLYVNIQMILLSFSDFEFKPLHNCFIIFQWNNRRKIAVTINKHGKYYSNFLPADEYRTK